MIAFLPVARYRVQYQVASGRPFSSFEKLLLAAIHGGNATLNSLVDLFRLHSRIVIEGIVTLMQAGWVCLAQDGSSFITTESGRLAAEGSGDLPATTMVSNRSVTLAFEKVSGQLARSSDVNLYTKQRLEGLCAAGVPVPPSNVPNVIEPGMVTLLLPHETGERIRLVGPISVVADNRLYALVDVDLQAKKLSGIPTGWHALLSGELLERVERAATRFAVSVEDEKHLNQLVSEGTDTGGGASWQTSWESATLSRRDVLNTSAEHGAVLETVLADAQSHVTIVSSHLVGPIVEEIVSDLRTALSRDLLISVFWGTRNGDQKVHDDGLELLKKLEYDSHHGDCQGRLVVNSIGLGSSFNALISDHPSCVQVLFGSFGWLCSSRNSAEEHLSLRLAGWPVGARFCDFVADLASKEERIRTSSAITSLRKAGAALRSSGIVRAPSGDPTIIVEGNVFFDETAHWYIGEVIEDAKDFVAVHVENIGPEEHESLLSNLNDAAREIPNGVILRYSGSLNAPGSTAVSGPIVTSSVPGMKSNAILADGTSAVIGNRALFLKTQKQCRPYGFSVALALRGADVGKLLSGDRSCVPE